MFTDYVVATDRPTAIRFDAAGELHAEGQPAIEFSDGFEIYCQRGELVPKSAVMTPDEIKWGEVEGVIDSGLKGAVARAKSDQWAKHGENDNESEEERKAAAGAAMRLAGVAGLAGLTEEE